MDVRSHSMAGFAHLDAVTTGRTRPPGWTMRKIGAGGCPRTCSRAAPRCAATRRRIGTRALMPKRWGIPSSPPRSQASDGCTALLTTRRWSTELVKRRLAGVLIAIAGSVVVAAGQGARFIGVDDDPALGDPKARVTIIEFGDYQCPFCGSSGKTRFPGSRRIPGHRQGPAGVPDFPQSVHPEATAAAQAAECAEDQGRTGRTTTRSSGSGPSAGGKARSSGSGPPTSTVAADIGIEAGFNDASIPDGTRTKGQGRRGCRRGRNTGNRYLRERTGPLRRPSVCDLPESDREELTNRPRPLGL